MSPALLANKRQERFLRLPLITTRRHLLNHRKWKCERKDSSSRPLPVTAEWPEHIEFGKARGARRKHNPNGCYAFMLGCNATFIYSFLTHSFIHSHTHTSPLFRSISLTSVGIGLSGMDWYSSLSSQLIFVFFLGSV